MGVSISCKKTGRSIDLGYGGFNNLREKVAELSGEEFGQHYGKLSNSDVMFLTGEKRKKYFEQYDAETERLIQDGKVNVKIADFCYQSDCEGRIRYGACKKILDAIGNYDDNILYGYCGRSDCAMFRDFKSILQDCATTKSDLVWW